MQPDGFLQTLSEFYAQWELPVNIVLAVLAVIIVNQIVRGVLYTLDKKIDGEKHVYQKAFVNAIWTPLRLLVWVIGLSFIVDILVAYHELPKLQEAFIPVRDVVAIALVAWFFLRAVNRVQDSIHLSAQHKDKTLDATVVDAVSKLTKIVVFILALMAILQSLGYSIAGLLAFGGAAGIAVGFAAQSLVANLFGGLTIFATRMFSIGEDIIIPGTEIAGTVEHIGWRATRVMGWNLKPYYVPNARFNDTAVINHSRMYNRRLDAEIFIRLEDVDKVEAIVEQGNKMIAEHPGMDHSYQVFRLDAITDQAVKLYIYAYTDTKSYAPFMETKQDILLKMTDIIKANGAELARPVSHVYTPEGVSITAEGDAKA